ncbi:hypothetical protein [Acidianus manzaensis]|nr:hypothetical protein [Acidianus manzaensis]
MEKDNMIEQENEIIPMIKYVNDRDQILRTKDPSNGLNVFGKIG